MNDHTELSQLELNQHYLGNGKSLALPAIPVFETLEEERLHRKQKLAGAFRLFSRFGFDEGVAGHITARDPEFLDTFWVNPYGVHFGQVKVSNLIRVDHENHRENPLIQRGSRNERREPHPQTKGLRPHPLWGGSTPHLLRNSRSKKYPFPQRSETRH